VTKAVVIRAKHSQYLVGMTVHYVASNAVRDTPDGKKPDIRAFLITGVIEQDGQHSMNGLVFRSGPHDPIFPILASELLHINQNEDDIFVPGTWHLPRR
jgi:hypothetical protein